MLTFKLRSTNRPPLSTSNLALNFVSVIFFLAALEVLKFLLPDLAGVEVAVIGLLLMLIPLVVHDLCFARSFRHTSSNLSETAAPFDTQRLIKKLIGLLATLAIVLVFYRFNPFYWHSAQAVNFYAPFFDLLVTTGPAIVITSSLYFVLIDRYQKDPYDSYWHLGCLLTGRLREVNSIYLQEHARVWFIKAFFTPFMFGLLVDYMNRVQAVPFLSGPLNFNGIYQYLLDVFYMFDVVYGVLGYVLTMRLLDNHIRSTEPTVVGWLACLSCYSPFSFLLGVELLKYAGAFDWQQWLVFNPVVYYFWGSVIIFLSFVYGLSTVAFGYRMSNLTYRGVITSGPYRFTKHPAYLSKVLSWWMISLPFYSIEGPAVAFRQTVFLVIISLIYFLRAKTEENHLSNYPEYVEYAEWINEHGLFRGVKKYFPALKYSAEKARRWNNVVWFKKLK